MSRYINCGQNFEPLVNTPSGHMASAKILLGVLRENYVNSSWHFPFALGKNITIDLTIVF